jgi:transcription initiation factor TFIID subunit 5
MDFSKDNQLIAIGTMDSYIRVWTLDGSPLRSAIAAEKDLKINNRKLIGHSGPVYGVGFSDAIESDSKQPLFGETDKEAPHTGPKFLVSCSQDGTVRLWSLEVWACMVVYKGHHGPVFKVQFSPHGHYFLTGGWDKTGRIWMQDHVSAVRLLVGHDTPISSITWHPNGTYVFTASDETDKSIRMWSVVTGECVRVFVGHTDYISSMECAPNGRILASADCSGNIFFWDLEKGTKIKRSRGHGKGGVWSLSFSVESNVLCSAGQDCTVRVWDVNMSADGHKAAQQQAGVQPGQEQGESSTAGGAAGAAGGAGASTQPQAGSAAPAPGQGKKKGKEVMVTPDQISCWATKKTPVRKVMFTRMNLIVAGGCYEPER